MQVYWTANTHDSDAVVRAKARRIINYAIRLNANSIAVTFPFYTHAITSATVSTNRTTTPTPAPIAVFLSETAMSHIRPTLHPILNETALAAPDPLTRRPSIVPAHPT